MIKKSLFALALAGISIASAHADTTIDTTGAWDGYNYVHRWGESNTATYGQTFTTGASDTLLKSFSFYMNSIDEDYRAYVATWDNSNSKISSVVWSSPVLNADTGLDGFDLFKITPNNGLQLQANTQYVAFFSTSGLHDGNEHSNKWGLVSNVYNEGKFVYLNNGNDPTQFGTVGWNNFSGSDLAFKVVLTQPVPEPETYAMFLAGLGIMGAMARRRKQA